MLSALDFIRKCIDDMDDCPCCGKTPILSTEKKEDGFTAVIRCYCGLSMNTGITYKTEEDAIDETISGWNQRVYR